MGWIKKKHGEDKEYTIYKKWFDDLYKSKHQQSNIEVEIKERSGFLSNLRTLINLKESEDETKGEVENYLRETIFLE